jgi:hypothetical protein
MGVEEGVHEQADPYQLGSSYKKQMTSLAGSAHCCSGSILLGKETVMVGGEK